MSVLDLFRCPNENTHPTYSAHCSICGTRICDICEYIPPKSIKLKRHPFKDENLRYCKNHYYLEDISIQRGEVTIECANGKCRASIKAEDQAYCASCGKPVCSHCEQHYDVKFDLSHYRFCSSECVSDLEDIFAVDECD